MIEGLTEVKNKKHLHFGNIVHYVLEHLYAICIGADKPKLTDLLVKEGLRLVDTLLSEYEKIDRKRFYSQGGSTYLNEENDIEENFALAEPTIKGYLRRWFVEDVSAAQFLGVEEVFNVPYPYLDGFPPIPRRGKIDRRGRLYDSRGLWLWDIKTKGRVESNLIVDTLSYNQQLLFYAEACEGMCGEYPLGITLDVIRRTQLELGAKETLPGYVNRVAADIAKRPDFYFPRFNTTLTPEMRKAYLRDLRGDMEEVQRLWHNGEYWRRSSACYGSGYSCEFIPICGRGKREGFKVKEVPFPELLEGAEE